MSALLQIPFPEVVWLDARPRFVVRGTAMSEIDPRIARAASGDDGAFRELFLEHRGRVARLVTRLLGPADDVEDVVQEVFLHVHRSLASFRGEARFSTWLYRLAANVSKMHLRRKRSRPRLLFVDPPGDRVPADAGDPETDIERRGRIAALYRLLDGLSEKKRAVLVLHDLEGMDPREIADVLEIPPVTVRTRLFYARKELYAAIALEPALAEIAAALLDALPGRPKDGAP